MSQEKTASSLNRNEIKVSAEGVAKLTFNFLEELQCDSSLEPGEVKTPPHTGCSPVSQRSHSPAIRAKNISSLALEYSSTSEVAENRDATKIDDGKIKTVTKSIVKSASQLEAEACEEKVRAILELDAIKQREEKQKRKELRRQSLEKPEDEEAKRKAKEERKRLKRLKKGKLRLG